MLDAFFLFTKHIVIPLSIHNDRHGELVVHTTLHPRYPPHFVLGTVVPATVLRESVDRAERLSQKRRDLFRSCISRTKGTVIFTRRGNWRKLVFLDRVEINNYNGEFNYINHCPPIQHRSPLWPNVRSVIFGGRIQWRIGENWRKFDRSLSPFLRPCLSAADKATDRICSSIWCMLSLLTRPRRWAICQPGISYVPRRLSLRIPTPSGRTIPLHDLP